MIGKTIGRYYIVEQLGEGGMAEVFRARDLRLERDVAFKMIRLDRVTAPRFVQRFEREARALAQLVHPHIVRVNDYGEEAGVHYLVMDYIPGGTLKHRFDGPVPADVAARLLAPIARALDYAHGQGVLHRDVKPANILLTTSGLPLLSDFGIAKIVQEAHQQDPSLTASGLGLGTPEYTAPEQWIGRVDARSDVYSLGVVFFELVTGRRPYSADTPAGVLVKQATEPLPRPRSLRPDLPERVEQVLLKALARDPDDRYATMGAFALELESLDLHSGRDPEPAAPSTWVSSPSGDVTTPTLTVAADTQATPEPRARRARFIWPVVGMIAVLALSVAALWQQQNQATAGTATAIAVAAVRASDQTQTAFAAQGQATSVAATQHAVAGATDGARTQAVSAALSQTAQAARESSRTAQALATDAALATGTAEAQAAATSVIAASRTALALIQPPCREILVNTRVWQGALTRACLPEARGAGTLALEIAAADWSIVEVYSALIAVEPNRTYEVAYWIRTDLEVNGADLYGRVVAAQYSATAQETQPVTDSRLDTGFGLGASVGGVTPWTYQTYVFTTLPDAAFVRLRGLLGGPVGTARGKMWLQAVRLTAR